MESQVCHQYQYVKDHHKGGIITRTLRFITSYPIHMASHKMVTKNIPSEAQYIFVVRHGDRWDYANPSWKNLPASRKGDSPLSPLGHQQARQVGIFLDQWFHERNFTVDQLTWLSSPFLRCLQTSTEALNAMHQVDASQVPIRPEYAIFEWDGKGGEWHADLPSLEERKHYFPRIDMEYETMFVPTLPEPRSDFLARCQKCVSSIHERYPYKPGQVLVLVSHAAGCIALARSLTQMPLNEITPAAPCAIYGFQRTSDTSVWELDPHDDLEGTNGYTGHLSDVGSSTTPWNHFGDGKNKFYTGPPTSRFAPEK
eukprot:Nitzschia sp. Nitz4//scaffold64_size103689//70026//71041//NITZ4_004442-RA/size103689-snap-gene-0.130-mRNA-1//-1//CDS//3329556148//4394//frame0